MPEAPSSLRGGAAALSTKYAWSEWGGVPIPDVPLPLPGNPADSEMLGTRKMDGAGGARLEERAAARQRHKVQKVLDALRSQVEMHGSVAAAFRKLEVSKDSTISSEELKQCARGQLCVVNPHTSPPHALVGACASAAAAELSSGDSISRCPRRRRVESSASLTSTAMGAPDLSPGSHLCCPCVATVSSAAASSSRNPFAASHPKLCILGREISYGEFVQRLLGKLDIDTTGGRDGARGGGGKHVEMESDTRDRQAAAAAVARSIELDAPRRHAAAISMDELKRRLHAKYANLRDAFRAIDVDSDNTLSHAEVLPPHLKNDLSLCSRRLPCG